MRPDFMSICDAASQRRWRHAPCVLALAACLTGTGPAAALPRDLPRETFRLNLDVPVIVRDGTRLSATIYRPVEPGTYPVLFVITPYTADRWQAWGGFFARNGYIFACVDARGRGNSEGGFEPWINEGQDGVDVVRALSRLPGSDGRVAAWGGSYSGKNQWAFASAGEPALKAIAPAATGYPGFDLGMLRNVPMPSMMRWLSFVSGRTVYSNLNQDESFWAGAYAKLARGELTYRRFDEVVGKPNPIWQGWADHPDFDEYWRRGTPTASALASINIPVLAVTGTYDDAQLGTLRYWSEYQGRGPPKPNGYLVIGPWDHGGTRDPQLQLGGLIFGPNSRLDIRALNLGWYDWVLKGRSRPAALRDHFVYYVAGADRWDSAPTLAAATKRRETLYLASPGRPASSLGLSGALTPSAPSRDEDSYVDDPAAGPFNEGPEGGQAVSASFLTDDRIVRRLGGDGLIYDTAPFVAAAELAGRPEAKLYIAMDVPDADIRVQLYEVRADGSHIFLGQDQLRARYRDDPAHPRLLASGRVEEYRFDQFPFLARRLEPGSRVRLVICSLSASIYQQRNRHSGKLVADETPSNNRVARVRLKLGPALSRITLPFGAGTTNSLPPRPGRRS